ncbi:FeoA family protein [Thermaurantiacus sp.]
MALPLPAVPLRTRCRIARLAGAPDIVTRLVEMGFDEGVEVEPLHAAPLRADPIAVRVGSTKIALRRALADLVLVEPCA